MSGANEGRLELAAWQINAALQHGPEEAGEMGCVAFLGRVVVPHRLGRKEQRPHAAGAGQVVRQAGFVDSLFKALGQPAAELFEIGIWRPLLQFLQSKSDLNLEAVFRYLFPPSARYTL